MTIATTAGPGFPMVPSLSAELEWAIDSPPLLTDLLLPHQSFNAAECRQLWLQWQPATGPDWQLPKRLGRRFEALWQYWLASHPRWQLLASGLVVAEAKRTLGEFDLLLRDRQTGQVEHWELAAKFYLGEGDLEDPANWHGTLHRDRLEQKLAKLCQQQLMLGHSSAGKAALVRAGLSLQQTRAIVKGRLFYPLAQRDARVSFAAPDHERGCWATRAEWRDWLSTQGELLAMPVAHEHWLARIPQAVCRDSFRELLLQPHWPSFSTFLLSNGEMAMVVPDDGQARRH
ncbi:DUF1853 family protein [Permianibacter sp. IMCC34836]|uniref:DUF1853 family protein n=1 Tax=Permianibacter fluminis TaxID=2738515 RepID=UPI001555C2E0|nr:DUF1853 family protein [Permianibacter fluminis]NQD36592.1 DUF1853 family protein [Permianibacter fluminis]